MLFSEKHPLPDFGGTRDHQKYLDRIDINRPLPIFPADILIGGSIFYTCAGNDGRPVQYLGKRIQSFVYADYGTELSDLERWLVASPFKGYERVAYRDVDPCELSALHGWERGDPILLNDLNNGYRARCVVRPVIEKWQADPWLRWMVFQRSDGFDEQHGPARFSLIYCRVEGAACYKAIYSASHRRPNVICIIQPGDGSGGGWENAQCEKSTLAQVVKQNPAPYLVHGGNGLLYHERLWRSYGRLVGYFKHVGGNGLWAHSGTDACAAQG